MDEYFDKLVEIEQKITPLIQNQTTASVFVQSFLEIVKEDSPHEIWEKIIPEELNVDEDIEAFKSWMHDLSPSIPEDKEITALAFRIFELESYGLIFMYTKDWSLEMGEDITECEFDGPEHGTDLYLTGLKYLHKIRRNPSEKLNDTWHRNYWSWLVEGYTAKVITEATNDIALLAGNGKSRHLLLGFDEPLVIGKITPNGFEPM